MKRTAGAALLFCLCAALCTLPAAAKNRVAELEIDVALARDGSAAVTQVWTADASEGTEFYLTCRDSGYLTITDFSVSDPSGTYVLLEEWDVDASFAEKTGKCGVRRTDDGVELCWGISAYGPRRYTLSYVLHGLVGAYADADGFLHRFVDEMDTFPTRLALTIRRQDGAPLTDADAAVWAFGYDGQIRFEDGVIRAWSESDLESGQHMTVMVSLEKGALSPLRTGQGSFEAVKERALEDAGQEEGTFLDFLAGLAGLLLIGALGALAAGVAAAVRRTGLRRRMKRAAYFRDAPNGGNLNVTHRLGAACGLCREEALLGAYLLRLISDGALEPEESGGRSSQMNLRLVRPPRSENAFDDAFYTILEAAAGTDGILQAAELEEFCNRNARPLAGFADSCRQDAGRILIREGCLKGAACRGMRSLTGQGRRQLDEILGLKRFLLDFSLIHERGAEEAVIWQDYLIYAYLLGIADRVTPQLRRLYPDDLPQVDRFAQWVGCTGYYSGYMYGACLRERQEAERAAGKGGRAFSGGGGGFSGGGGGGTR